MQRQAQPDARGQKAAAAAGKAPAPPVPSFARRSPGLTPAALLQMQRLVGNSAVVRLILQRLPIGQIPRSGPAGVGSGQRLYYVAPGVGTAYGNNLARPKGENIGIYTDGMTGCASIIVRHANGDLYLGHFPASAGFSYDIDVDAADERDEADDLDSEQYEAFLGSLTESQIVDYLAKEDEKQAKNEHKAKVLVSKEKMHFSGAVSVALAYGEDSTANYGHQAALVLQKFYRGQFTQVISPWVGMNSSGYVYHSGNAKTPMVDN